MDSGSDTASFALSREEPSLLAFVLNNLPSLPPAIKLVAHPTPNPCSAFIPPNAKHSGIAPTISSGSLISAAKFIFAFWRIFFLHTDPFLNTGRQELESEFNFDLDQWEGDEDIYKDGTPEVPDNPAPAAGQPLNFVQLVCFISSLPVVGSLQFFHRHTARTLYSPTSHNVTAAFPSSSLYIAISTPCPKKRVSRSLSPTPTMRPGAPQDENAIDKEEYLKHILEIPHEVQQQMSHESIPCLLLSSTVASLMPKNITIKWRIHLLISLQCQEQDDDEGGQLQEGTESDEVSPELLCIFHQIDQGLGNIEEEYVDEDFNHGQYTGGQK
ncbi:hypothetical protein BJ138DRAFT_1106756 [Hygrophoropsis aurantiaca]|uniref:Uncharacterized protein n=1 Tax=Hygrophoropsis aurantiaca TaxID=72124 RepID=A0ACB7ZTP4_9AGAM|nr:hypothetical protein BJ138DRAFT_1106756 [Hygrophoropsis aurantiaca]